MLLISTPVEQKTSEQKKLNDASNNPDQKRDSQIKRD